MGDWQCVGEHRVGRRQKWVMHKIEARALEIHIFLHQEKKKKKSVS